MKMKKKMKIDNFLVWFFLYVFLILLSTFSSNLNICDDSNYWRRRLMLSFDMTRKKPQKNWAKQYRM